VATICVDQMRRFSRLEHSTVVKPDSYSTIMSNAFVLSLPSVSCTPPSSKTTRKSRGLSQARDAILASFIQSVPYGPWLDQGMETSQPALTRC
jgi:hypothetical protein